MVTVVLKIRLDIPGVSSLKEKRRIIKSMIARLKNSFNISMAEVGDNDVLRTATLGAAVVSNNSSFGHRVIAKVIDKIEAMPDVVVTDIKTETY